MPKSSGCVLAVEWQRHFSPQKHLRPQVFFKEATRTPHGLQWGSNGLQWAPMGENEKTKYAIICFVFFLLPLWRICLNNKFKSSGELF